MVKTILFDVMGVVFEEGDDLNNLLVPFVLGRLSGIAVDDIRAMYLKASLGEIRSFDFWLQMKAPPEHIPSIEQEYLDTCFVLDPCFIPCAKQLSNRYRLALLSNDVAEWSAYLRKKYNIDKYIGKAFISGDMGIRKPDPAIYRQAMQELGCIPQECLFIDDDPERVLAAVKLGMKAVLFNRTGIVYEGWQIGSFRALYPLLYTN